MWAIGQIVDGQDPADHRTNHGFPCRVARIVIDHQPINRSGAASKVGDAIAFFLESRVA
ncbi:hypothetical protein D3C72_1463440 [compost metagenome]